MEYKVINCPHCGKIIPDYALKGESKRIIVTCLECGSQRNCKTGKRDGKTQTYICSDCCRRFSVSAMDSSLRRQTYLLL